MTKPSDPSDSTRMVPGNRTTGYGRITEGKEVRGSSSVGPTGPKPTISVVAQKPAPAPTSPTGPTGPTGPVSPPRSS